MLTFLVLGTWVPQKSSFTEQFSSPRTSSFAYKVNSLHTAANILQITSPTLKTRAAVIKPTGEYRAFWFAFYDYDDFRKHHKNNASSFTSYFANVVKNGKKLGMNTIIVHVRPFGDAMYKSSYFPWSANISGRQGKSPGYDPLKIMVEEAHRQNMRIEAWINPYRVTKSSTNYKKLAKSNPARKWHSQKGKRRNVLSYGGQLYYNPAKAEVRKLIVNGVKEIVMNYDVDGIHMDDYFYPSFSASNVSKAFDAPEYKKSKERKQGKSISSFRRTQVNLLVKQIHAAVKAINPDVTFGISPAGSPSDLSSNYQHYVDYRTWLRSSSYIDYICPQIYWGFKHSYAKFDTYTGKWVSAARNSRVKLYIGIAVYKAGHNVGSNSRERKEWRSDTNVLKKQIAYGRKRKVDGFAFFDYSDLVSRTSSKAVKKMRKELKKKN
ncbi:MAG: family 10 glycosylhydrolase [Eubacterium sp.]|nr:family 10 glycosylhydrolase [Eubacterium sp.]